MTTSSQFDSASLRTGITAMYRATDRQTALIRGAHLNSVVRLTPQTMAANIGSATIVLWAYRESWSLSLWIWWLALLLISVVAVVSWMGRRGKMRSTASPRALHHATLHAAVLSGVWAFVPLFWFPAGTAGQQVLIATLVTGMLGAGTFVLSPLPLASMAYALVYTFASLGALWRAGNPTYAGIAVLLGLYSPMVIIGALFAWRKATALLLSQAEAVQQEGMLTVLLQDFEQNANEALWEIDGDGKLTHLSPRLADLLGVEGLEGGSHSLLALLNNLQERQSVKGVGAFEQALGRGHSFRDVLLSLDGGKGLRHLLINGKPLLDPQGAVTGWRGVLSDATDKVEAERRLRQLAHTDSLTGLANRFTLRDALQDAILTHRLGALLTIDLDHFKVVNDSYGHSMGDELLKAVSLRLRACVRPGDLVARLGGDEFAVLMLHSSRPDDASALANRLVHALLQPLDVDGRRLRVGGSVGVVLCDGSSHGVDELLAHSDTALYEAKATGRGRYAFYTAQLGERSRRRGDVENGLRQALDEGQIALHWQPKVDIASWQIVGVEGLMRWTHPQLGPISPVEFIAIAEHSGIIDELGLWALREACRALAGPLSGLCVSVNVSPVQLRNGQFVNLVADVMREFRTDPATLELEITESVFLDDAYGAMEQLHGLKRLGVRIALDDFGTGYSSLAYLRQFRFDTLKIDRAFVNEVLQRADAQAIVQLIAQLASTLGMRTVSEGVESAPQLAALAQVGCHEVQGYLVSPALPLDALERFRREWRAVPPVMVTLH